MKIPLTNHLVGFRIIVVGSISDKPNGADKYSVSDFSQIGLGIDIYAPGHDIYSTHEENSYTFVDGTSFAAPQVVGVASMIWGLKPNLTGKEVKEIIVENYTHTVKVPRTHPKGSVSYIVNSEQVFNKAFPVLDAKAAIDKITRPIYEIELTWGETSPNDMDLYFKYPGAEIPANYVCFYQPKFYFNDYLFAEYLGDDITTPGEERINIYAMKHGTSSCKVAAKRGIDRYATSDVKVKLYKYGRLIGEFTPPKEDLPGEGWLVFDIVNGEVVPVNTIGELGYITVPL